MNFGKQLKSLRKNKKLTIDQLASLLRVNKSHISRLENSKTLPSQRIIKKIARRFKVDENELNISAGNIPTEIRNIFYKHPDTALSIVKEEIAVYERTPQKESGKKQSPIFSTELGQLYNSDCLDLLHSLPDNSVDCIFADPPFNLGKIYGQKVNDKLEKYDYLGWCHAWLAECSRILKENGSLFVYNLPKWNIHIAAYLDKFLTFRHWISIDMKYTLPIPKRLYPSHYSMIYFVKGSLPKTFHPPRLSMETCRHCGNEVKDYGGYKNKMNPKGINLTDVWYDIPPVRHAKYKTRGANELSIKLLDRVLDMATDKGDLVLDPFGGSGSTYITAELKERRWIGSEIEDCGPILERFKKLDEQKTILENYRKNLNSLFTEESLKLRKKFGHSISKYRIEEEPSTRIVKQPDLLDSIVIN